METGCQGRLIWGEHKEGIEFKLVRDMVFLEQFVFKSKTAPRQDCPRDCFKEKN